TLHVALPIYVALEVSDTSVLDLGAGFIELAPVHGPVPKDVTRAREDYRMVEVGVVLGDVEHGRRRDPIQLVTARSLYGVDDRECPADAEGPLGGEGARPDVLGHLDLALARLELVAEGEAGHETEHRHEPRISRQVVDECLHAVEAIGPRPVLEVGAVRILVMGAETHHRLVGPRVVVQDRDINDPGLQGEPLGDLLVPPVELLEQRHEIPGREFIGIVADEVRRVRRADVDDPGKFPLPQRLGDEGRFDIRFHAHLFVDLDEDEFIAAELISRGRQLHRGTHRVSYSWACRGRMVQPRSRTRETTARALSSAPGRSECRQMVSACMGTSTPFTERMVPLSMRSAWSAHQAASRRWFSGSMMMWPSSEYSRSAKASAATRWPRSRWRPAHSPASSTIVNAWSYSPTVSATASATASSLRMSPYRLPCGLTCRSGTPWCSAKARRAPVWYRTACAASDGERAMARRPNPMRSGNPGCDPSARSCARARATDLAIVPGSPACHPHATLIDVISGANASSAPSRHCPKLSPASALISMFRASLLN